MPKLTPAHRDYLAAHAIDPDFALTLPLGGVRSVYDPNELPDDWRAGGIGRRLPEHGGILFPWVSVDGRVNVQLRPDDDKRPLDENGRPIKYLYQSGRPPVLWAARWVENPVGVFIPEGSKQTVVAAQYAPEGWAVLGMAGCWGFSHDDVPITDLEHLAGLPVVVGLDADAGSNLGVWTAGSRLAAALKAERVKSLKWLRLPAGGKAGLDDVIFPRSPDKRAGYLATLLEHASDKVADAKPKPSKKTAPSKPPQAEGDRAAVITNRDRREVINDLSKAMTTKFSGTDLFNHGGVISKFDGSKMAPLDRGLFNDVAADAALMVSDNGDGEYTPGWADENTMRAVLSRASDYAPLDQIRRCPFVREDGSICQEPGYDPASRAILVPGSGLEGIEVPENPTPEQVAAARELILETWLGDMPFPAPADRANALALAITPFVRGHFERVPLAVVDGLQMGVGKNKLADCVAIVVTGEQARPMNFVDEKEELRKQITSAFSSGSELFVFDEAHTIDGAALAQALTASTWADRILGVTRIAEFPNRVTWVSLGNQVKVKGDLVRRVYRIALWPRYANPQDRPADTFRHPGVSGLELEDWTRANRAALVRAVLVLVRAWFAAGRPAPSRRLSFGSFTPWERMVGGIIEHAGVPGFLGHLESWRSEADEGSQFTVAHLAWLREQFGDREFKATEVRSKALSDPQGYDALLGLEDTTKKEFTKELGKAYGRMKDRNQGGLMIVRRGGHAKTVMWSVLEVSEVSEGSATPFAMGKKHPSGVGTDRDTPFYREKMGEAQPSDTSDTSTLGGLKSSDPSAVCSECGGPDPIPELGRCFECDAAA